MALLLVMLGPGIARADGTPTQVETLRVANRKIIDLKGPIAGYSAKERIELVTGRIDQALAQRQRHELTLEETEHGTRILIDGQAILIVTPIDIDSQIGETTQVVADEARKRLERAVSEFHEQRSRPYLIRAGLIVLGATAGFALLLFLLSRLTAWVGGRLLQPAARGASKLRLSGIALLDVGRTLRLVRGLVVLGSWAFGGILTLTWLAFALVQFPYTRPWGEGLREEVVQLAKDLALAAVASIPGLLTVVLIALLARALIRFAGWFFDRLEIEKLSVSWLAPESVQPTRRIFSFVVWAFALVMAYPYLPGADTDAFKGLSVLLGVMVSIGGSSIFGQMASGLTLMYARTVRVGDYVRIGDSEGTVTEIGLVSTRLRTGLGEEIVIPSATVMGSTAKNYSRSYPGTGYVVDTSVTIGYATPWRQVHAMLLEAARLTPSVADAPAPIVRQLALGDFYVEYRLAAYTPAETPHLRAEVLSELHANIQDVFNRYGVQIMSPHYLADPPSPQVVPPEDWFLAPARREPEEPKAP